MTRVLRGWLVVSFLLSAALASAGLYLDAQPHGLIESERSFVKFAGLALALVAGAALLLRHRFDTLLRPAAQPLVREETRVRRHPYWTLFLASFVGLFVEVMLIRYASSQIRIFSFYKNIPLVAAYLGMGIGCWRAGGRPRHAVGFLLWLLPLALFLSLGSVAIRDYLGFWAALSSSEHILGDAVVYEASPLANLAGQLLMASFCVVILVSISLLFTLIGRLLGDAFEGVPRLPAYTTNILGSLAGILLFLLLSYCQTPPWVWFPVGLVALLWWLDTRSQRIAAAALIALTALSVAPEVGDTVWSRYQKLVGHYIPPGPGGSGSDSPAYHVEISDVFYQVAIDLRPENVAQLGRNPFPHYDGALTALRPGAHVLIVGAGTGNDVAAALRANAAKVDAVDIDPAIVEMGRLHHPEDPYSDPRVNVIVDDARSAFRHMPEQVYDAVIFGLLDSHTQLGMSSVRLDNYVFTLESLATVRGLLKPGGHIILTAATFRPWFQERFAQMLAATCDTPVTFQKYRYFTSYACQVERPSQPAPGVDEAARFDLPTDDWPFLYLSSRGIPSAYLVVVALLAAASVIVLRSQGLRLGSFNALQGHMFFLGAGFLLMEVHAVNRLALLFGTTWLVSAVTIALVLTLIVMANFTVILIPSVSHKLAYPSLVVALVASYFYEPTSAVGGSVGSSLAYGLFLLLPVYFAGIIFARSFSTAKLAGPAIGANMFGAVLGAWVEYLSMIVGFRALVLLALVFYMASLQMYLRHVSLSQQSRRPDEILPLSDELSESASGST
jgi:SAM-dependent methyltransferase